jgi:hypothetical protein
MHSNSLIEFVDKNQNQNENKKVKSKINHPPQTVS